MVLAVPLPVSVPGTAIVPLCQKMTVIESASSTECTSLEERNKPDFEPCAMNLNFPRTLNSHDLNNLFIHGCSPNRIYQEGSEASAAVVAVETHTIHKLEEGIGEWLRGVGQSLLCRADQVSLLRGASLWLCPCRCCSLGSCCGCGCRVWACSGTRELLLLGLGAEILAILQCLVRAPMGSRGAKMLL